MTIPSSNGSNQVVSEAGLLVFLRKTAWKAPLKPWPALGYSTFSKLQTFSQTTKKNLMTVSAFFCQRNVCYFLGFNQKNYHTKFLIPNWGVYISLKFGSRPTEIQRDRPYPLSLRAKDLLAILVSSGLIPNQKKMCWKHFLVGGWTNPFETYMRTSKWVKIFPNFLGVKRKNMWVATS